MQRIFFIDYFLKKKNSKVFSGMIVETFLKYKKNTIEKDCIVSHGFMLFEGKVLVILSFLFLFCFCFCFFAFKRGRVQVAAICMTFNHAYIRKFVKLGELPETFQRL